MSSPDPETILPLLEALEKTLLDSHGKQMIPSAYGSAPFSVSTYPAAINIPGPSRIDMSAGGDEEAAEAYEYRTYRILLAVAPSGAGISGEVITRVNPYYAAVRSLIMAHTLLGNPSSGIFEMTFQGDTGLQGEINIAGTFYTGTVFSFQIAGRIRVPYATGE